jgi:hypothetical protein
LATNESLRSDVKVLLWDVETSHNVVAAFQLKQDYIHPDNILIERHLVCAAWKWFGDKRVEAVSVLDSPTFAENIHDDRVVCEKLHEILSSADVIVAHNGDKFDIKFVEARMLVNGLSPLPPIVKLDTMKTAKKRFLFNSNRLDYLGQILGVGRKMKTPSGLWLKVLNGDRAAIEKMVSYNKVDVRLLERVFIKLKPYMANFPCGAAGTCARCGSAKLQRRGVSRNATRTYQRWQCQGCGGWSRSLKADVQVATERPI